MILIEQLDYTDDVFDITVEDNHNFFANDILVHNCTEITLHSDAEYTFSCVLSSMNCALYDEWKDTDAVFNATVFLDCVNQDLIEIGKKTKGMEKVVNFAHDSRALGLGLLGFHTYLQDNLIPLESIEAHYKNIEIFKLLDIESKRASEWMAKEWGEPEWCKGYGVRNTHRIAIAPNLCLTPDTKIILEDDSTISYEDLTKKLGIDFDSLMTIDVYTDDGEMRQLQYNEKIDISRDNQLLSVCAYEIQKADDIEHNVKVTKIVDRQKTWFKCINEVNVKTPEGSKKIEKVWFNGFTKVYELMFRNVNSGDVYNVKSTPHHKFLSIDHGWIEAQDLIPGYLFQNDYVFDGLIELNDLHPTMDIEVPVEHCFFLESGIISHNTSALVCGSVSQGIEPIYKNAYIQNTSAGKMERVNPSLLTLMKKKNVYTDKIVKDLIDNNGSVQHVAWLTDHEKMVFKTAFEIDQKELIRLASARQKYIDQAQSINLFFGADETEEYISEVHKMAFKDKWIKSLYYIRSSNGVNISKGECVACHA